MKKTSIIVLICILIVFCLGTYACFSCDPRSRKYKELSESKETDGLFDYYYDKNRDEYILTGDMWDNNPEIMYMPAYYKNKEIHKVFEKDQGFAGSITFGPSFKNVKKLYISYSNSDFSDWENYIYVKGTDKLTDYIKKAVEVIICASQDILSHDFTDIFIRFNFISYSEIYLTSEYYNTITKLLENKSYPIIKESEYQKCYQFETMNTLRTVQISKANITYLFNYENSPNGGVFFIDNYGYGESIKNPPYDPIREGYTFEGWYKESECINKWNFETDTLPIVEYDEDGNPVEFIETKLYAKWIKN